MTTTLTKTGYSDTPFHITLFTPPPAGHDLWLHPNVTVVAQAHVNAVDFYKPTGYPNYTSSTPANVAKRVADWIEYQGLTNTLTPTGGSIGLVNLGATLQGSTYLIMTNAADAVADPAGAYVLYHAHGSASGTGTAHDWMATFSAALSTELTLRNLAVPSALLLDNETRSGYQYVTKEDGTGSTNGWWPLAIASPRYTTEAIYEGTTLSSAYAAFGSPSITTTNHWSQGATNRNFVNTFLAQAENQTFDYALHLAVYTPLKSVFPSMDYGNYEVVNPTSSSYKYYDRQNNWLGWYNPSPTTLKATLVCPAVYGPDMTNNGDPNYAIAQNGTHGLGTTTREIWRNFTYNRLRAATVAGVKCRPSIEVPGSTLGDYTTAHTPDSDDILWLIRRGLTLGVTNWTLFTTNFTTQQADDTLTLVQNLLTINENQFVPDRRPRAWMSNTSSPEGADPQRLSRDPLYLTGGVSALLAVLQEKLSRGFPVPVLHTLPGNPLGQGTFTSAFWGILSEADKRVLQNLPSWVTEIDFYAGFQLDSPHSYTMDNPRNPDYSKIEDQIHWAESWAPLLNTLTQQGIRFGTLWLDAASATSDTITALTNIRTQIARPRLGGEALPITDVGAGSGPGGRSYNLNQTAIAQAPWHCSLKFFRNFSTGAGTPWTVDPTNTECRVVVQYDDLPDEAEIQALIDAGFIVDSWGGTDAVTDGLILSLQDY